MGIVVIPSQPGPLWPSARMAKVIGWWWAASAVSALLLLTPFETILREQSDTAGLDAFDPFVLWVTLGRDQHAFATALGVSAIVVAASKICAQLPLAWALVLLAPQPEAEATPSNWATCRRALRAVPLVTLFSLLADGIPLGLLALLPRVTGGIRVLLAASDSNMAAFFCLAVVTLGAWLLCLALLDFARIAVVTTPQRGSVWGYLIDAGRILWRAPWRILWQSALARTAGATCLAVSATLGLRLTQSPAIAAAWLAWVLTQAGGVLALYCRVAWLGAATRHAQSLRPPNRSS